MRMYEFSLILNASELTEHDCDTLYNAGCDDGTIITRNGTNYIAFDREADSLEIAIQTATQNVRQAGFEVIRVEMDAPMAVTDSSSN